MKWDKPSSVCVLLEVLEEVTYLCCCLVSPQLVHLTFFDIHSFYPAFACLPACLLLLFGTTNISNQLIRITACLKCSACCLDFLFAPTERGLVRRSINLLSFVFLAATKGSGKWREGEHFKWLLLWRAQYTEEPINLILLVLLLLQWAPSCDLTSHVPAGAVRPDWEEWNLFMILHP